MNSITAAKMMVFTPVNYANYRPKSTSCLERALTLTICLLVKWRFFAQCHLSTRNSGKAMKNLKFGGLVELGLCFLRSVHTFQQLRMELKVTLERLSKLSPSAKILRERRIHVAA